MYQMVQYPRISQEHHLLTSPAPMKITAFLLRNTVSDRGMANVPVMAKQGLRRPPSLLL